MMQPANLWNRDYLPFGRMLDSSRYRSVAFQREMSSGFVIVREVAPKNSPQVGLAQYDDMIEALAADTAVQPLNVRVLPWRSWCRDDFLDTHVF